MHPIVVVDSLQVTKMLARQTQIAYTARVHK